LRLLVMVPLRPGSLLPQKRPISCELELSPSWI
jgi:hypothetical protein